VRLAWLVAAACAAFWAGLIWREGTPPPEHPILVPRGHLAPKPAPPPAPEACAECHADQHRAWASSRHAATSTSPLFALGLAVEPAQWCLSCHAPGETDASRALAHGRGVTCRDCHQKDGAIATTRDPAKIAAPHALVHVPDLAVSSCEPCHQSDVPLAPAMVNQDTMDEWRAAGGARAGTCASCHGGNNHALPASRDPALLARGVPLSVRLAAEGPDAVVTITLGPVRSGHRVPTGDPFRELAVRWKVEDAAGAALAAGEERLARKDFTERTPGRDAPGVDDRLRHGEVRRIVTRAAGAASRASRASVELALALLPVRFARHPKAPKIPMETPFARVIAERESLR
jgi:hypothetical protein